MLRSALKLLLGLIPTVALAIEEPTYEVVRQIDDTVELRRYAPYVVAEVVLNTPAGDAGNQAFPILAGYIFGKNKGQRKLETTAPVAQGVEPLKLQMTAPVTQSAVGGDMGWGMRVQFVLPMDVTLADAPEPLDPRVRLREEPAALRAVIRYSGTWSQANYDEHLDKLQAAMAAAGITTEGEPVLARYNGPMTPWFLRRNEIWLAVP
ncbi:MAG TPA: heme-binding protein [Rubrivivax sp.]|nr:heme-binding protein [Rubrivivax sp.]